MFPQLISAQGASVQFYTVHTTSFYLERVFTTHNASCKNRQRPVRRGEIELAKQSSISDPDEVTIRKENKLGKRTRNNIRCVIVTVERQVRSSNTVRVTCALPLPPALALDNNLLYPARGLKPLSQRLLCVASAQRRLGRSPIALPCSPPHGRLGAGRARSARGAPLTASH